MFHVTLRSLIDSSKVLKVGGKQKPYQMWQAGISLAASPLTNSSRALPAMEYGGSAAARRLTHPVSYAGYISIFPCFLLISEDIIKLCLTTFPDTSKFVKNTLLYDVFDANNFRTFKIICPKCRQVNTLAMCSCLAAYLVYLYC